MSNAVEEYLHLKNKFPREGTGNINCENCDWCDRLADSKNCYYAFDGSEIQECLYSYKDWRATSCVDTLWNAICERCYEVSDSIESSDCSFSQYLAQCYNVQYSFNCNSCHDCFGCTNLSHKEYCIFNVQYTEEEYENKLVKLKELTPEEILKQVEELRLKFPKIQSNFSDNENSDYVDYVYKSHNAYYCFDSNSLEDCGYVSNCNECKDSWDCTQSNKLEHCAESLDSNDCYNCYRAEDSTRCYDSMFLTKCTDCHDCFMCVNLSNAKYCILNVQYTKEEYFEKLIGLKKELGLAFSEAKS